MNRHAFSQIARNTVAIAALTAAMLGASPMHAESFFHTNSKPVAAADNRIEITLRNQTAVNRVMRIGEHLYTVIARHAMLVRVTEGTVFAAYTPTPSHPTGSTIMVATPNDNHKTLELD